MGKLLTTLETIDKRNKIESQHTLAKEDQGAYVDTQIDEMRKIIHRNRVDVLLNEAIKCNTEDEKLARDHKIRELESNIRQLVDAVNVLTNLADEL